VEAVAVVVEIMVLLQSALVAAVVEASHKVGPLLLVLVLLALVAQAVLIPMAQTAGQQFLEL
jgi:hypothetical protein